MDRCAVCGELVLALANERMCDICWRYVAEARRMNRDDTVEQEQQKRKAVLALRPKGLMADLSNIMTWCECRQSMAVNCQGA